MSSVRELPHSYIKIGKRYRKDLGDLSTLAESIRNVGLIQRIVVDKNHNLIVGHRRFEAYRIAKPDVPIPVIVVDDVEDIVLRLKMERDENTCREPMVASDIHALGKQIERLERPSAAETQGTRSDLATSPQPCGKVATAAKVGEALGLSTRQWEKLKGLGDAAANGDETAASLLAEVDSGAKSLNAADLQWRGRDEAEKERAKKRNGQATTPMVNTVPANERPDRSRVAVQEREQRLTELAAAGHTSRQIAAELGLGVEGVRSIAKRIGLVIVADQTVGRAHLLDSNRILRETIHTLEGLTQGVGLIVPADLDKSLVPEWSDSLGESLRDLRALHTLLKGMQSNG